MAYFALIKDGMVQNCIVADQDFIDNYCQDYDACIEYTDGTYVGPGFSWDGSNFTPPPSE